MMEMKKDKEWLKEKVVELFQTAFQIGKMEYHEADESVYVINGLVSQLEEPEKPVIPQYVADYIETYKGRLFSLGTWLNFVNDEDECESKTEEWLYGNGIEETLKREYLLIDAIRYGYEVEKLYHVKILRQFLCVGKNYKDFIVLQYKRDINSEEQYIFTEQEIKSIDERFWVFAEEVTT